MKKPTLVSFTLLALLSTALLHSCGQGSSNDSTVQQTRLPKLCGVQAAGLPDLRTMLEADYAEGRLLVRFKNEPAIPDLPGIVVRTCSVSDKFGEWGVSVRHAYHGELAGLYLIEGDFLVRDMLPFVLSDPEVLYAEPDYKITLAYQPDDPEAQSGTAHGDHLDIINAFDAWDVTRGDPSFVIAINDHGCLSTHEDLADNLWTNAAEANGVPGVDDDGNGYVDDLHGWNFDYNNNDISDTNGHGTIVSSAAAAVGENGVGIAGVAYQCKFAALKGCLTEAAAVESFQYAVDMGFKVVNVSWTVPVFAQPFSDAIEEFNNSGGLLVCAAGNFSNDLGYDPVYPPCFTHDNIIVVLNTDMNDLLRYSSNWGDEEADLAAPGTDIYLARGTGGYGNYTGTSYSAPLVTGACALLWSKYPFKTHIEIKQLLLNNVDVLPSLSGLCVTGGRLNIRKALDAGGSSVPTLEAEFTADKIKGTAPFTTQFTDQSTGSPTSWDWNFGDGGTSDQQHPAHNYAAAGTYTVELTVSKGGPSDTETKTAFIEVFAPGSVIADFSGIPRSGPAPLTVSFTDKSEGDVTAYLWTFGDGSTSYDKNPTHTYNSPGTYTVSLTASGAANNNTETKAAYVTVGTPAGSDQEKKGSHGGCSLCDRSLPRDTDDVVGYFMSALLLAAIFAVMKLRGKEHRCLKSRDGNTGEST